MDIEELKKILDSVLDIETSAIFDKSFSNDNETYIYHFKLKK